MNTRTRAVQLLWGGVVMGIWFSVTSLGGAGAEGYSRLKDRTVRIWDANKKYTMKHYDMRAWKDRAIWSQVPHGTTDYQFRGDCILEGENFWVSLHSSRHDSVFL